MVSAGAISLPSVPSDSSGRPMEGSSWGMPPKRLPMVSTGRPIKALIAVAMIRTASGPGIRRIHATPAALRFHRISVTSEATATAIVGRCRLGSAE